MILVFLYLYKVIFMVLQSSYLITILILRRLGILTVDLIDYCRPHILKWWNRPIPRAKGRPGL